MTGKEKKAFIALNQNFLFPFRIVQGSSREEGGEREWERGRENEESRGEREREHKRDID